MARDMTYQIQPPIHLCFMQRLKNSLLAVITLFPVAIAISIVRVTLNPPELLTRAETVIVQNPVVSPPVLSISRGRSGYDKVQLLTAIAIKYAEAGQAQQAEQTFSLALQPIQAIKNEETRIFALGDIYRALEQAGQFSLAVQIFQPLEDIDGKASLFSDI